MAEAVYQVKQWNGVFENHDTRRYQRLKFVGVPVEKQSETFSLLMETRDGVLAYGLFTGPILRIAAGCPVRGVLLDERGAYTADRVARRFNIPKRVAQVGWDMLILPSVGWLEETPLDAVESARRSARQRALGTAPDRASNVAAPTAYIQPTNQPGWNGMESNQPDSDARLVGGVSLAVQTGPPNLRQRTYDVLIEFGVSEKAAAELADGGVKASRVAKLIPTVKNAQDPQAALVSKLRKEIQ